MKSAHRAFRRWFPPKLAQAEESITGTLGTLIEPGKRVLWVSSCGGHLAELKKIADLYPDLDADSLWVTFDTPQARSILAGHNVHFIPPVGTRDVLGTIRALLTAYRILRSGSYHYVVSTGAAVAVSFLPLASAMGVRALYVESLARTHGASATGRLLELVPAVRTYTQYERWAGDRWKYAGSVLDDWEVWPRQDRKVERLLVSLGTIHPYRFDRAVDAVMRGLPDGCAVTWQLGATTRNDLPGVVHEELAWTDMSRLIRESDVFVCHAGVGSVLQALDNGAVPVLAVRSASHGEHVDDHQSAFAQEMLRRGLGLVLELQDDGTALLQQAAELKSQRPSSTITKTQDDSPLRPPVMVPALGRTEHPLRGHRRQPAVSARRFQ
jgi:UDP-N-acetylglucosamine--N-acetylmuramyl-(pentapeptide) pyrophosphoryl-undecaprenol N-acetylglucosamine transferase